MRLARQQQRLGLVDHRRVPQRRVLLGERHVFARARRAAPAAAPRRAASARAGRAPPARPAAATPPAGRARCLPRRDCGGASRCRPDRTSLRRRPRRSPRAPRRAVARARRARAPGTECRPAGSWLLARTSRWPIVAGATRKAEAIVAASKPSTVCRISGARMPASIAGCAQANISASRSSGISVSLTAAASSSSATSCSCPAGAFAGAPPARRRRSILRRATVSSHASGLRGTPLRGQSASAAANASASASSAAATSRVRAARKATSLP